MAGSGYPGKKGAVGGASIDRVQYEAGLIADDVVGEHEVGIDPHPQYVIEANLAAFFSVVGYYKWRSILGG